MESVIMCSSSENCWLKLKVNFVTAPCEINIVRSLCFLLTKVLGAGSYGENYLNYCSLLWSLGICCYSFCWKKCVTVKRCCNKICEQLHLELKWI
jgi:hypothetical protein